MTSAGVFSPACISLPARETLCVRTLLYAENKDVLTKGDLCEEMLNNNGCLLSVVA